MITIGADPELFLRKNDKFISAIGKFGGTKEHPRPFLPEFGPGFAIQEDNVAVEFNIPPIRLGDRSFFADTIERAVQGIRNEASKFELDLAIVSSAVFTQDQLDDPRALVFGCDPDFNAWSLKANPRPSAKNKNLRSAGGHVHIGGDVTDKIGTVRAMDLFAGCPSIVFDDDTRRRELYGKAGAMRDKSYGVEYRTLSSFWLRERRFIEMIHDQTAQAVAFVRNGDVISDEDGVKIINCINNSDKDLLRELTAKYGLVY